MKKRILPILLICAMLLAPSANAAPDEVLDISAASAALIDCESGRVLYEKEGDKPMLIASTTKIMTALVVLENCALDEIVRINPDAVGIEGSSLYLKTHEKMSVEDLLYGLMLRSGNDAAVALAIHCAGSVDGFVGQMNEKAAKLGLENCSFANPNGLDDEDHFCSANDLGKIAVEAMQNEEFRKIVSTKTYRCGERAFTNHNKLLWRYEGAIGVKTGFTEKAGRTLVGAAESDGNTLIAVTLNAPSDWSDQAKMLDYGFINFRYEKCVTEGDIIAHVPVVNSGLGNVAVKASEGFSYPLAEDEELTKRVILPQYIYAPIEAGDLVGTIEFFLGDESIGSIDLDAAQDVLLPQEESGGLIGWIKGLFK